MTPLTPDAVMTQIAAALPDDCRPNVIIIGSLAVSDRASRLVPSGVGQPFHQYLVSV